MSDSLTVFGTDYTGVTGIKAKGTGNGTLTYIRPSGTKSISANGTGIDVTEYASVDVAVPGVTPTGNINITQSGVTDVTNYASATVAAASQYVAFDSGEFYTDENVRRFRSRPFAEVDTSEGDNPGWVGEGKQYGEYATYQAVPANTTVTPTTSAQTVGGAYYMMEGPVTVAAMPSGTAGTPTATKGSVSNHSVSVTPSVTNVTGYITGGTKTGTAVSVSASELVSGTYTVSASGTHDVTNYASASVAAGGATASATKGTVSNHSVTVTPSVTRTAGYVTAGSANGTAVTVSASELVSGNKAITDNGTNIDVTNYSTVSVDVGGSGYTLTTIVSQQTVTPDSSRQATPQDWTTALVEGDYYLVTLDGTEYVCTCAQLWGTDLVIGDSSVFFGTSDTDYPFALDWVSSSNHVVVCLDTNQHTIKVEHLELDTPAATLTTKTITANGTYNASSDSADGYSSVTVNVSGGGGTPRTSADLTVSGATVTAPAGVYASDASKSVASMTLPTAASATSSGTSKATITPGSSAQYINIPVGYNGTASYYTISATSGSSKNVQVAQSTSRATSSTYTNLCSLTCSTAGTYDVYWDCFRSSTGGTSGSQLYVGGSAYGSANTAFTNHIQTNHLTGVSLTKNQTVAVYARSRGSNYYAYCGQLTIVQTA